MKRNSKLKWLSIFVFIFILIIIGGYHSFKPLPQGISYEGKVHYIQDDDVKFLSDLTYESFDGKMTSEQQIFSEVFNMIKEAKEFIIIDMFLFNSYTDEKRSFPNLSGHLTELLIQQKKQYPKLKVIFITDPINNGYYSYEEKHLTQLKENGIEVVLTNLSRLRDSNKAYSAVWRLLFKHFGQSGTGWLPNPFAKEAPPITLRSYLALFNVKSNHRKTIITEHNALVTSANPHNESGFASNIGFKVSGGIIVDIIETEQAVLNYSDGTAQLDVPQKNNDNYGKVAIQYLTEGKILKHIIAEIEKTEKNDTIWSGMFYIANRDVIDALHRATDREVKVDLILDPNKVAFGNQKTGLPNIPVASELVKNNDKLAIRWYHTGSEQYHTKLLYIKKDQESVVIGGSANYTTRNLNDLNLENNIKIKSENDQKVIQDVDNYFLRLWNNEDGIFTVPYEKNEDALTPVLKLTYWVQKLSGLTTY